MQAPQATLINTLSSNTIDSKLAWDCMTLLRQLASNNISYAGKTAAKAGDGNFERYTAYWGMGNVKNFLENSF